MKRTSRQKRSQKTFVIDGNMYRESDFPETLSGDGPGISTPAFWQSVTLEEFDEVWRTGCLNTELCARLWRFLDRQDPPPKLLRIYVRAAQ
jgi:hypothetical protein